MKQSVKIFILICNTIFFMIACIWFYTSKFSYEPLLALGQSLLTIIILLIGDNIAKQIEVLRIKYSIVKIDKDANARVKGVKGSKIIIK